MCSEPTTATSLELRLAVLVPPQPAASSATEANAKRSSRLMEKAPFAAVSSRCLARGQYSIDQSERLGEAVLAHADLVIRRRVLRRNVRVDPRVDADGACRDAPLAGELRNRLREQLDVELEAERGDVARLLVAEQVAGTADLEVAHRDREAGAELGVVGERGEA